MKPCRLGGGLDGRYTENMEHGSPDMESRSAVDKEDRYLDGTNSLQLKAS